MLGHGFAAGAEGATQARCTMPVIRYPDMTKKMSTPRADLQLRQQPGMVQQHRQRPDLTACASDTAPSET